MAKLRHEDGLVFYHENEIGKWIVRAIFVIGILAILGGIFKAGMMYERKNIVTLTSEVK